MIAMNAVEVPSSGKGGGGGGGGGVVNIIIVSCMHICTYGVCTY